MFTTAFPMKNRPDGTFVVQHRGYPYHVCSRAVDPENLFDLDEVRQFAEDYPELVSPDGPDLDAVKASLVARIEAAKAPIMRRGFAYTGGRVQADDEAQGNLTAWIVRDGRGSLTYPKTWLRAEGAPLTLASASDLDALADAMEAFKEGVYYAMATAKAGILAAETPEAAQAIFDTWAAGV